MDLGVYSCTTLFGAIKISLRWKNHAFSFSRMDSFYQCSLLPVWDGTPLGLSHAVLNQAFNRFTTRAARKRLVNYKTSKGLIQIIPCQCIGTMWNSFLHHFSWTSPRGMIQVNVFASSNDTRRVTGSFVALTVSSNKFHWRLPCRLHEEICTKMVNDSMNHSWHAKQNTECFCQAQQDKWTGSISKTKRTWIWWNTIMTAWKHLNGFQSLYFLVINLCRYINIYSQQYPGEWTKFPRKQTIGFAVPALHKVCVLRTRSVDILF